MIDSDGCRGVEKAVQPRAGEKRIRIALLVHMRELDWEVK